MLVARVRKFENYITFRTTVEFPSQQKQDFSALSPEGQSRFRTELFSELSKARVHYVEIDLPNSFTIERTLPITSQLSEADFVESLTATNQDAWIGMTSVNLCMERTKGIYHSQPQSSPSTPAPPH